MLEVNGNLFICALCVVVCGVVGVDWVSMGA